MTCFSNAEAILLSTLEIGIVEHVLFEYRPPKFASQNKAHLHRDASAYLAMPEKGFHLAMIFSLASKGLRSLHLSWIVP